MLLYFIKIPYPKYTFSWKLTKFQQCMLKRIHRILISPDGPTKISNNRCLYAEVHYTLIKYEKRKSQTSLLFCLNYWLQQFIWSTIRTISRSRRNSHWSCFSKSHRFLQHLSSKLGINWTKKNVNALQKHYFCLWQWV